MILESIVAQFHHELQDLHSAEQQLTKVLPKMIENAMSDELRQVFETHLAQTREHLERLDSILSEIRSERGASPRPGDGRIDRRGLGESEG